MKKLHSNFHLLFSLIALALFTQGCAITSQTATPADKAADIQALAYTAASIGTAVALEEKPANRIHFQAAHDLLDTLVTNKQISATDLRTIFLALPVKELKSPVARLAIDNAVYLYTSRVGGAVNLEAQPYVLAAATGLRDGLKAALGGEVKAETQKTKNPEPIPEFAPAN
jgi:hypothetical protein